MKRILLLIITMTTLCGSIMAQYSLYEKARNGATTIINFNVGMEPGGFALLDETSEFYGAHGTLTTKESSKLAYNDLNGYFFDIEVRHSSCFTMLCNISWSVADFANKEDPLPTPSKELGNITDYPTLSEVRFLGISALMGPTLFHRRRIQLPILIGGGIVSMKSGETGAPDTFSEFESVYQVAGKARLKIYLCRRLGIFGGVGASYSVAHLKDDKSSYWHLEPKLTKVNYEVGLTLTL